MMNNTAIEYVIGGAELLDSIEQLWTELRRHHARVSTDFSAWFGERSFSSRKAELLAQASADMRIEFAMTGNTPIGYCVSTLSTDYTGEVDSLFVDPEYRGAGIGSRLMRSGVGWLEERGASPIIIVVVHGNDKALHWYAEMGFAPKTVKMQLQNSNQST